MNELIEQIRNCKLCPLYTLMPAGCRPVCGIGPLNARNMIIGEALGADEAILEEPFVGQCGQLLNKMLKQAGLSRESCYITNVVKCRPVDGKKNRPPKKSEINACKNWLYDEIMMIEPKNIFALGRVALSYFIELKPKDKLQDYIGKDIQLHLDGGVKVVPLYHPSFLMQHSKNDIITTTDLFRRFGHD